MKRPSVPDSAKAALLGTAPVVPSTPAQSFVDKYDLNNPRKRLLVAAGVVGAFMGVLKVKSFFT